MTLKSLIEELNAAIRIVGADSPMTADIGGEPTVLTGTQILAGRCRILGEPRQDFRKLRARLKNTEEDADESRDDLECLRTAARAYLDARASGTHGEYEREILEGLLQ